MACRGCSSGDGCECSVTGLGSINVTGAGVPVTNPYVVAFSMAEELDGLTVDDATACDDLNDPHVPVLLGNGSVFMVPLPCPTDPTGLDVAVPGNAFAFTYSATTTDADPGDGILRLNNATISSVTSIFVDLFDILATDISAWLDSLDDSTGTPEGRIRLYSRSAPSNWADFNLISITAPAGYRKLVVTYNDHNGALTTTVGDTVLDFSSSGGAVVTAATETVLGVVELATTAEAIAGSSTTVAMTPANVASALSKKAEFIRIDVSQDETSAITTGNGKHKFRMPFAMTVTAVRASLAIASSSGTPTIDINDSGTTILSTKITLDITELTSTTAAVPAVISDASLADDAEISIDIDVAGTGAAGLKVQLIGTRT